MNSTNVSIVIYSENLCFKALKSLGVIQSDYKLATLLREQCSAFIELATLYQIGHLIFGNLV